jgi:hypothetical protein
MLCASPYQYGDVDGQAEEVNIMPGLEQTGISPLNNVEADISGKCSNR